MGGDFASAATRLAGLAGAILGWRPHEFWSATPAELGAVIAALSSDADESMDAIDLAQLMEQFPDG